MTPLETLVASALASCPLERRTNTPVEVLATYMVRSLDVFEAGLLERSAHPFFYMGKRDAS